MVTRATMALGPDGRKSAVPATATVLFTAHNRKDLVLDAIRYALTQTIPVDIIIADDASSDGTQEAVRAAYPDVTYLRSDVSRGPCFQRNRGLQAAQTDIVFPLDDDSMLVSPRTLEQAMVAFADPTVGIVAMPFQNILQGEAVKQGQEWVIDGLFFDFVACAHGVRRQPVAEIGGYYEPFFYMGEETDLAIRLHDIGLRTVICESDPLHHLQPPARRSYRPDFYGRRNDVLFAYVRAPAGGMPLKLIRAMAAGMWFGLRTKRIRATLDGFAAAWREILTGTVKREPVSRRTFDLMMMARIERGKLG